MILLQSQIFIDLLDEDQLTAGLFWKLNESEEGQQGFQLVYNT